jgi:sec-independent protein translocase protein TatC
MKRANPNTEMPFLDHLEELRWRLIWMIGALFVGVVVGFYCTQHFQLISVLAAPAGQKLVFLHPADPITAYMTLSLGVGVVIALPVILFQLWGFVSPALKPSEKRVAVGVFAGGTLLFLMGVALAYFFVVPATLKLSKALAGESVTQMLSLSEYFSFLVTLALTFGAVFELPILILGLAALGLVTPAFLRNYRRHALVLCAIASALITPGDAVTAMIMLLAPLYLLYELGILLAVFAHRWRERRDNSIGEESPEGQPGS